MISELLSMGGRRHGQEEHLPSPGKCTKLDSLHLQHFGSHMKAPDPVGELIALLRLHLDLRGRFATEKEGHNGESREEWRGLEGMDCMTSVHQASVLNNNTDISKVINRFEQNPQRLQLLLRD